MNIKKQQGMHSIIFDMKCLVVAVVIPIAVLSCKTSNESLAYSDSQTSVQGKFTRKAIARMDGFGEHRKSLLKSNGMKKKEFISLSTDSVWALSSDAQVRLRKFREDLVWPDSMVLLQKVIPLTDLSHYEDNVNGGVVGGFVAIAADVKSLRTIEDVYYGLRLDYPGTAFSPEDEGYAVIRFYSSYTDRLYIPFGPELNGPQEHAWPNTGGGFTSSTLGKGGFPEWVFSEKHKPMEGAELYRVDAKGRETLSSVFENGKWQRVNEKR